MSIKIVKIVLEDEKSQTNKMGTFKPFKRRFKRKPKRAKSLMR